MPGADGTLSTAAVDTTSMSTIEEKRVYADRRAADVAYVASAVGVLRVRVANEIVGEFSLCERCTARDVAGGVDAVAVATDEDVLVASLEATGGEGRDEPAFDGTGFGGAVAVGYHDGTPLAADAGGRVARLVDGAWETLESDAGEVRAIDGDLVGTAAGVYLVRGDGLDHAGLEDVRDVAAAGIPLAATADGLYKLGNGWLDVLAEPVDVVATDPRSERGRLERAHAVAGLDLYEHRANEWARVDRSSVPIVGVAYGETVHAVTERGTYLVAAESDDGGLEWRSRTLGAGDVTGIAIPRRTAAGDGE